MSNIGRVFTYDEAMALVDYAQNLVFEACRGILGASENEEFLRSQRMLRRTARLFMWPELIVEEAPPKTPPVGPSLMSESRRELLYKAIGDRSRRVMSLGDFELWEELRALVRYYR